MANLAVPAAGALTIAVLIVASTATGAFDRLGPSDAPDVVSAGDGGPTTMIVGDSVAWYLGDQGFSDLQTDPPMRFVNDASPGCAFPPTPRFRYPDGSVSDDFTASCDRKWLERIRDYDVTRVVFVRGASVSDAPWHDGRYVVPCSSAWHDWYVDELKDWTRRFAAEGAHTYLVTMPAAVDVGGRPEAVIAANARAATCGNQVMKDVAAADSEHVSLIDLDAKLCPADRRTCELTWNGVTLRPDTVHFRGPSAPLVAAWLLTQMGIDVADG